VDAQAAHLVTLRHSVGFGMVQAMKAMALPGSSATFPELILCKEWKR
jgi:hypothetical protein